MSDREKKLVLLFGLAAFVLLNVFGIRWFGQQKNKLAAQRIEAESRVTIAKAYEAKSDSVLADMEWVADHAPDPRAGQIVATELENYVSSQATQHQLEVKRRAILANDEAGQHFHRARLEFNVTGKEDSLYKWLARLQMPDQFRAITFLRLSPDAKDDTLIDATVHAEQWYVPQSGDGEADPEAGAEPEPVEAAPAPPTPPGPAPQSKIIKPQAIR